MITAEDITKHHSVGKAIDSGLFRQPEAANLAGVLFSNAHTIAMFNRIGTEQGLGSPDAALLRFGTCYNFDPNASEPHLFAYVVGERPPDEQETFDEGLHLFINPWAQTPLAPEALPGLTVHELQSDGNVLASLNAGLHPFVSKTWVWEGQHADTMARYQQAVVLGRISPISAHDQISHHATNDATPSADM